MSAAIDPKLLNAMRAELLRRSPAEIMRRAGMEPDPWQVRLLQSDAQRFLLLCSRQTGKSQVAAAMALHEAMSKKSLILLLSPSLRQSGELFRDKLMPIYNALGRPMLQAESALRLELKNGSRILSLPGTEDTLVGFSSVNLLVIDEAARVSDDLYKAVRPMLAVSKGRLIVLSTPKGKRGWFWEAWSGSGNWERVGPIKAESCPRISKGWLDEERRAVGERWYRQEFEASFEDAVGSPFDPDDIQAAFSGDLDLLDLGKLLEID